jgi:uncharacterized membrane protein
VKPAPAPRVARLARRVAGLYRGAVVAAAVLVGLGVVLSFAHHPSYLRSAHDLAALERPGQGLRTIVQVGAGAAAGHGRAVALVGLGLLVVTPALGILLALFCYARARRVGVVLTCVALLAMLTASVFLGIG